MFEDLKNFNSSDLELRTCKPWDSPLPGFPSVCMVRACMQAKDCEVGGSVPLLLSTVLLIFKIIIICMHYVCASHCMFGGQGTTLWFFSSSFTWTLGIKLRWPGLHSEFLTH